MNHSCLLPALEQREKHHVADGWRAGEHHHQAINADADAARREFFEETGYQVDDVGQPVWTYDFEVTFDQADHNQGHAEYFHVRTQRFEPVSTFWTPEEHVDVTDWRWFSAEQLETSQEPYEPAHLPELIRSLSK